MSDLTQADDERHDAATSEPVMVACYSCSEGTVQPECERPEGGWVYDTTYGWRCPSCAEKVIESLRREVAALESGIRAAKRLADVVVAHQRYWQRVDWGSERAERAVLDALAPFHSGGTGGGT